MTVDVLERAFASTGEVLSELEPEHLELATPCASWRGRDLVDHVVGGTYRFAAIASTGGVPGDLERPDYTPAEILPTYEKGAAEAVAAFSAPGAMDRIVRVPIGELPGSAFMWIAAIDVFTHGWDLARTIGRSTDLDPELAAQLLAAAERSLSDDLRGPDGVAPFGPRVDVPASAPAADRLAAFMGRRP
jgi:uncharacterized protein (TIGR03086 family)